MQPSHIKTFIAPAAIAGSRVVTLGAGDGQAAQASAATDVAIGISERIGSRDNDRVDVVIGGIAECKVGGNVTRGDILTSDAQGRVVTSSQATDRIVGIALASAVADDIIDVLISQG